MSSVLLLQYLSFIHWHPDPEIFRIGAFGVRYYSLFFAAGIVSAYVVLKKVFIREKISVTLLDQLSVYVVVGTLAGARLGHCLFYEPGYFLHHPLEIFLPVQFLPGGGFRMTGYQGLASHGGALGILLGIFLFCRKYKQAFLAIADKIVLVVPLTAFCIRIGNFFNSEIIGKTSHLPWAIIFDRQDALPRHPAQLYEAVCYLLIFFFLRYLIYPTKERHQNGYLFGCFLILTFSVRILIEFVKAPQEYFEQNMALDMGQLLSLPFIVAGILLIVRQRNAGRP